VLDVIRKKKQSYLINGLLLIIVAVFVFFGVGTSLSDRVEVVATVNGESISRTDLERTSDNLARSFREMSPNAAIPPELVRSQALDQLITSRLFRQEAKRLGLQTTDEELRESITRIPVFQVEGQFSKEQYTRTLQANRRTPDFEELQREQVLSTVADLITAGAHVSNAEIRDKYRHDNERVNLRYVRVAADPLKPSVTHDADLEAYYNANKETFREPERARIEYVLFDSTVMAAQVNPSDDDVQRATRPIRTTTASRRKSTPGTVLFRGAGATRRGERRRACTQAAEVLKQLEAGGDFAELARKHSQDGTAPDGGDLGWFGRGRMVPAFEQAAFALAPGAMSGLVESPFGFHIIKVEEKRAEGVESLEEARPKIVQAIKGERGREQALQAVEAAHDRLLDGADLTTIASEAKLTVHSPEPFSGEERVSGLGRQPEMMKTIADTATGEVGDIVNSDTGYALFRVVERIESAVPELVAIRERSRRPA
jgi:peptidyl-prolyl cis-trans isomerase D